MDEEENHVEEDVAETPPPKKKRKRKKKDPLKRLETEPAVASMLDRVDAWKCAERLLHDAKWSTGDDEEIVVILPSSVLDLANWLLYGPAVMTLIDEDD